MKVKIKQGNKMLDATIEMVDGVMVVSPKVVKFEPKDGDVVFSGTSLISIFKEMTSDTSLSAYAAISRGELVTSFDFWSASDIRPATEEEKEMLFDKLAEAGYEWDAKKKEVIKKRWIPNEREIYFYPSFSHSHFVSNYHKWYNDSIDEEFFKKGWCFKTKEECQEFCNRLNESINSVKP